MPGSFSCMTTTADSLSLSETNPAHLLSLHFLSFPRSSQGIVGEGSAGPGVGLLSAVTSAVVVHKVTSEEGLYGMYVLHCTALHCTTDSLDIVHHHEVSASISSILDHAQLLSAAVYFIPCSCGTAPCVICII